MTPKQRFSLEERKKYNAVWKRERYHAESPALRRIYDIDSHLKPQPCDIVADFGCGTGRVAVELYKMRQVRVALCDIVEPTLCLDLPAQDMVLRGDFDFHQAPLWNLPHFKAFKGYCIDVLEHIPPEMIGETLASMSEVITGKLFCSICLVPDTVRANTPQLHISLLEPHDWLARFKRYFKAAEIVDVSKTHVDIIAQNSV